MIKRITEAELANEYLQQNRSQTALVTFFAGLAGAILCVIVFFMTERFLTDYKRLVDDANENRMNMTFDDLAEVREKLDRRSRQFFQIGTPLFITANALWIIGGYAWILDFRRNPSNKFLWRLGGILVLLSAFACGVAWFLLIRIYMEAQG